MSGDTYEGEEDGWMALSWGVKRRSVLRRDGHECVQCGRKKAPLEVDHIIALDDGGEDERDNLQTLCVGCHLDKHGAERRHIGEHRIERAGKAARYENSDGPRTDRHIAVLTCSYLHVEPTEANIEWASEKLKELGVISDD